MSLKKYQTPCVTFVSLSYDVILSSTYAEFNVEWLDAIDEVWRGRL